MVCNHQSEYVPKLIIDPADAMDTNELLFDTQGIANVIEIFTKLVFSV